VGALCLCLLSSATARGMAQPLTRLFGMPSGTSSSSSPSPKLPRSESLPPQFLCPITGEVMRDPVTTSDGHAFERAAIERWLATHHTSPMTGERLAHTGLSPAIALRQLIDSSLQRHRPPSSAD